MKQPIILFFALFMSLQIFAQLNMTLMDQVQYQQDLNDVWGWVDETTGEEYAIVGTRTGTSIVSVTDPSNSFEVQFIPGPSSTWRDIKTWGNHVYVTNETSNGLLVIDMTNHPDNITWFEWQPQLQDIDGQTKTLESCHNLYIDEFGWCYLVGCNFNNGGAMFVDVFSNPGNPVFVDFGAPIYAHDAYARDNIFYASQIGNGDLAIYNVEDKNNTIALASQQTPFAFTHNAWLNDAGDVIFTTDELANAPVAAYDISDLDDIKELDQYVPIETLGDGVIPHNVHVWNDWLIISYYSDGGIIVDASKPDNLIEVGNFDTFLGGGQGFNGAWGAYPFLPSGIVLVSDIGNGLYVLDANYVRACWLEGQVTNADNGVPIFNASVTINASQSNGASTDISGNYQSGLATAGTYDVLFEAPGFLPKTVQAVLENGELTILNVALEPPPNINVTGFVLRSEDGTPIQNARIEAESNSQPISYNANTAPDGSFTLFGVNLGEYTISIGKWGYKSVLLNDVMVDLTSGPITVELDRGYQDEFIVDLGWETEATASTGFWTRGEPDGTIYQGQESNPDFDINGDLGIKCYVTGNGGGGVGNDDVDDGVVTLISPPINMTNFNEPILKYHAWFFNDGGGGGSGPPNDELEIRITNGTDEVVLETISNSNGNWLPESVFEVKDFISVSEEVRVIFETSDGANSGHIVEAAVDWFRVEEGSAYPVFSADATEGCFPFTVQFNDFSDSTMTYEWTFENGNPATSNIANPSVTWNDPGTYDVNLVVTTQSGITYTVDQADLIQVRGLPISDFDFSENNGDVSFTNNSEDAVSWSWTFDDGFSSTEENPVHTYAEAGTYQVKLVSTNPCASHTVTIEVIVDAVPPTADFSFDGENGCAPFTVQFTDDSDGAPTSWIWSFPGGTPEVSLEQNPTVVYNQPGLYSATLEISNSAGDSEISQGQIIEVGATPTASFDYDEETGEVTFVNLSEYGITYEWIFGDGMSSSEISPIHTYTSNGAYEVTLNVTNDCGTVGFTTTINISSITGVDELPKGAYQLSAAPNPFSEMIGVSYEIENTFEQASLLIYNVLGQEISRIDIESKAGTIELLSQNNSGLYFIRLVVDDRVGEAIKVVKTQN